MSLRVSGGRRLRSPKGDLARPTSARVRLAVINLLAPRLAGARWLDLCCGSGAMACEALQHGVSQVVAVERDRRIATVAKANLEAVRAGVANRNPERTPDVQLVTDEVLRWLARPRSDRFDLFDLIYLDPPYRAGLYEPVAEQVARRGLLATGGLMVWECARAALPAISGCWQLVDRRDYGGTTLLLLQQANGST